MGCVVIDAGILRQSLTVRVLHLGDVMYIFGGLRHGAGSGEAEVPLPVADLWSYNLSSSSWTNLRYSRWRTTMLYAINLMLTSCAVLCAVGFLAHRHPDMPTRWHRSGRGWSFAQEKGMPRRIFPT